MVLVAREAFHLAGGAQSHLQSLAIVSRSFTFPNPARGEELHYVVGVLEEDVAVKIPKNECEGVAGLPECVRPDCRLGHLPIVQEGNRVKARHLLEAPRAL